MKNKPLIETNPHLKDPVQYKTALIKAVVSSSAIEGIHIPDIRYPDVFKGQPISKKTAPVRRSPKSNTRLLIRGSISMIDQQQGTTTPVGVTNSVSPNNHSELVTEGVALILRPPNNRLYLRRSDTARSF